MSARALSTATISFGLVSIPVKLFTTQRSDTSISFHLLHEACGTRLKQQYVCAQHEKVVPREEMVKGYEFSRGQYVIFTNEELKALEEEASKVIEIHEFVPAEQVPPVYFERAYYLGPDKGGDKPYKLLAEAMRKTGRCALASYAARGKQYLVMVLPYEDGLLLQQLRYAHEIKSFDEIERSKATPKPAELALAVQLIEQIASDEFKPTQYEDAVRKRLEEVIQKKVDGEEVTMAPAVEPQAQIIDLMEALKASLAGPRAAARPEGDERKGPQRAARGKAAAKAPAKASSARGRSKTSGK